MGLPPTQGHNNLRLNNTANLYPNYYRLATNTQTQFTRKQPKPGQSQSHSHCHSYSGLSQSKVCSSKTKKNVSPRSATRADPSRSRTESYSSQSYVASHSQSRRKAPPPASQLSSRIGSVRSNDLRRFRFADNSFPIGRGQHTHARHRKAAIVSNMPLINFNSSVVMVNHSPFGLREPGVGILHHCSQSISYF